MDEPKQSKISSMDAYKKQLLDNHNWEESYPRLLAFAISELQRYKFQRIRIPIDRSFEDFVMDAIDKVYSEERGWDPYLQVDLHRFLLSVVKSSINNCITGSDIQRVATGSSFDNRPVDDYNAYLNIEYKELDALIAQSLKSDPLLCLVYKGIKDGVKPSDIANDYAIDIKHVNNAKKRLLRIITKVLGEYQSEVQNRLQ